MSTAKKIAVLVYKEDSQLWLPSGTTRWISCNHTDLGVWGINMAGEIIPVPTTTVPPSESVDNTSYETATVLVQVGRVWVSQSYFNDSNFKVVVKVKDMTTNIVSFVNAESYNDNIALCNFVPSPSSCSIPTDIASSAITSTGATLTWTPMPGSVGIEYVNNTSATPPTGSGTYQDVSDVNVSLTGLIAATQYHFWIRSICGAGSQSAWTSEIYTTLP